MLRLRRNEHDARIEIMPLIDVIFLLLTFFIYAMVLMVRAELVPMEMHQFASGDPAEPAPVIAISIDQRGDVFIDRQPVTIEEVLPRIRAAVDAEPSTEVWIGADERGDRDRLPVFFDIFDLLAKEGLTIKLATPEQSP